MVQLRVRLRGRTSIPACRSLGSLRRGDRPLQGGETSDLRAIGSTWSLVHGSRLGEIPWSSTLGSRERVKRFTPSSRHGACATVRLRTGYQAAEASRGGSCSQGATRPKCSPQLCPTDSFGPSVPRTARPTPPGSRSSGGGCGTPRFPPLELMVFPPLGDVQRPTVGRCVSGLTQEIACPHPFLCTMRF